MTLPALLVEAFAERPCEGNGAAVVLLDQPLGDAALQALARSLNQSETAFLLQREEQWLLRWFTPSCEVPLCGHATLAALLALGHWQRLLPGERLQLHTRSGPLPVRLDERQPGLGELELPSAGLREAAMPAGLAPLLAELLGETPGQCWSSALNYWVVPLSDAAPLEQLQLPLERLPPEVRGGLVLMQALQRQEAPRVGGRQADYQLRFFAPGLGIPEDPVTGSAHALVAPYWQERLGRPSVVGWQCSHRPGGMRCEAASSGMIRLVGSGHLLWNGSLDIRGLNLPGSGCQDGACRGWPDPGCG